MRQKRKGKNKAAEVAKRVGVSLSTVSRALAGSRLISEETRRLVREAAESLDYHVDAAGSSLRTGLTRTIGVVIPLAHAARQNLSDPFFLEILGAHCRTSYPPAATACCSIKSRTTRRIGSPTSPAVAAPMA